MISTVLELGVIFQDPGLLEYQPILGGNTSALFIVSVVKPEGSCGKAATAGLKVPVGSSASDEPIDDVVGSEEQAKETARMVRTPARFR
ncbi:MAG TPA: hypothetical protein VLK88_08640 [Gemmatimonadales bacterium]|nr:hypothetical protein [Gemmatimonadales bacterium]